MTAGKSTCTDSARMPRRAPLRATCAAWALASSVFVGRGAARVRAGAAELRAFGEEHRLPTTRQPRGQWNARLAASDDDDVEVHAVSLAARPLGALSIDGAPHHIRWLAKSRSAELVIQERSSGGLTSVEVEASAREIRCGVDDALPEAALQVAVDVEPELLELG